MVMVVMVLSPFLSLVMLVAPHPSTRFCSILCSFLILLVLVVVVALSLYVSVLI